MKSNYELRAAARESLSGNWTYPVLATLIYLAISIACNFIPYVSFLIAIFFVGPLAYGLSIALLKFFRGEKENVVENEFDIFSNYPRILGTVVLQNVYIFLWSLLLLIPGLIKGYSYAMTYYILHDNPEIGAEEAICRSMKMMDGHKWQLFCLHLSFIGWWLLCILTLGIGMLWLAPYIQNSTAAFYEDLKSQLEPAETTTTEEI